MRRKLVKTLYISLLFAMVMNVSGCFSWCLSQKIGSGTTTVTEFSSDDIVGFSEGIDSNKNKGWVFVGNNFDYLLTSNGDVIAQLLRDNNIDKTKLSANDNERFVISPDGLYFDGEINLSYDYSGDATGTVSDYLVKYGFKCSSDNLCGLKISKLHGSIHKKNPNQNNGNILKFHHPVAIKFYQYKEISTLGAAVLYPVTVAADIVTSPLQLIASPFLLAVGSMGTMKAH